MKHEDILTAARNRIAEIDAQMAELTAERAKLAAMVDASGGATGIDILRQLDWPPPPPAVPNERPCVPPLRVDPFWPYIGDGTIVTACSFPGALTTHA